jgi:hypothetical protein
MLAVAVAALCSVIVTVIAGIVLVTKFRTFHLPDPTLYVVFWLALTALMWATTRWLWRSATPKSGGDPSGGAGDLPGGT